MGESMRILAIDVGTSAVKAGYWDGRRLAATSRVELAGMYAGDRAEIAMGKILRAVEAAAREVMAGRGAVEVMAFDAFSSGVVGVDARGKTVFGAVTHQDRRSAAEAQEMAAEVGEKDLLRRAGNLPFAGGIGSSTLRWMRKHERARLSRCAYVGQASSVIGRHLTGRWVIDPSQACFLGLMDIRKRQWDRGLCDLVGVSEAMLPRVEFADEVLGMTLAKVSGRMGVRSGTPVVGGFVDTSAAVLNTPMQAGQLVQASGTTDVLALCVEGARPAGHLLTRPVGVGRVFPERWLSVSTISSAGGAVMWAREVMFGELGDGAFEKVLQGVVKKKEDGELGVVCEPWLAGDRTSLAVKRGSLSGLHLGTTREDILGAIVAGLAKTSAERYAALAQVRKIDRTIYTMGGAKTLAVAMRRGWSGRHRFVEMQGDGLAGLVKLAERTLGLG